VDPDVLTQELCKEHQIFCTSGNHYCTFWSESLGKQYGLDDVNGATRLGFLHYNTADEVERVLQALKACSQKLQ
jgi:selenocysteine lyase/cysteine desulfurase